MIDFESDLHSFSLVMFWLLAKAFWPKKHLRTKKLTRKMLMKLTKKFGISGPSLALVKFGIKHTKLLPCIPFIFYAEKLQRRENDNSI